MGLLARGGLVNLLVGIVGAVLGGVLVGLLTGRSTLTTFDFGSLLVAVLGAVGLLLLLRLVRRA